MKVNDFGLFKFCLEKKGYKRPIECFGTITKVNGETIEFQDNDGFKYKIDKNKLKFKEHKS